MGNNKIDFLLSASFSSAVRVFVCAVFLLLAKELGAQQGTLSGFVADAATTRAITGAQIVNNRTGKILSVSMADGIYSTRLDIGDYSIAFRLPGFRQQIINGLRISSKKTTYLNIILQPAVPLSDMNAGSPDSLRFGRGSLAGTFDKQLSLRPYNSLLLRNRRLSDLLGTEKVLPGNFENGWAVANGLNGVISQQEPLNGRGQSFIISAMGQRYNQLLFNGASFYSFDPVARCYPLELIPTEAINEASVQTAADASLPGNFAGGTVSINTRDRVSNNFFYIRAGSGLSAETVDNGFDKDQPGSLQWLGLPGAKRALPHAFPTTRSQYPFNAKNIQEQAYLSTQLKNNIAPVYNSHGQPDSKFVLGFGRNWQKKDVAINLVAFVQQSRKEQFTLSSVQSAPDVTRNAYPFNTSVPLIGASSSDSNYTYQSHLTAVINASAIYRKSKISFKNFIGSQFTNTFTRRSSVYKPDEDTLAHAAIHYLTTQHYFIQTQLSGEHVLGDSGALRLEWQASYNYLNEQQPDERSLLLRQDSLGNSSFALASPTNAQAFGNSGRQWRNAKENNFSAFIKLQFPFRFIRSTQLLQGGIYIQENYRKQYTDLLFVQGAGYVGYDKLLAPERYYPGGTTVSTFYVNNRKNPSTIQQSDRPNYNASGSLGASWLQLDANLHKHLLLNAGVRAETNSQLSTNVYYQYATGFKNPQAIALDENTRITTFNILPSAKLTYTVLNDAVNIVASYSRTVDRPQLQELVKYAYYDSRSFVVKTGNGLLATSLIDNYYAGISLIPNAFSNVKIGGFFKKIDHPIEYVLSDYGAGVLQMTPHNTGPAEVKGLEAAFRIQLHSAGKPWVNGITFFASGNISSSSVKAAPLRSSTTPSLNEHALSGSPAFSANGGLLMQYDKLPQLTVSYSRTGDYLVAVGSGNLLTLSNTNQVSTIPAYRFKGRNQLDIQLSQQILKHKVQLIGGIRNATAADYITYQDLNGNKKFDDALQLETRGNRVGYYLNGTDNTVSSTTGRRTYYLTISFLFN